MKFTERCPIEDGFAQIFEADVKPKLVELEFERQAVLRKTHINMALVGVAVIVAVVAYGLYWGGDKELLPFVFVAAAVGVMGALTVKSRAATRWKSTIKDVAMPSICAHVGDLTYSQRGDAFSLQPLYKMNLLPRNRRAGLHHMFTGTYHGTQYQMVRAVLTSEASEPRGLNETGNFEDLLFRVELPSPAPGQIALTRDRGGVGNKLAEAFSFRGTRSMPKVIVNDHTFEAAFEVYASQPDAAKAYLFKTLIDMLMRIGYEQGQGKGAQSFVAGFADEYFYLALMRTGSFMTVGNLTEPVIEIEDDLHGVFRDIELGHTVIDRLNWALSPQANTDDHTN